MKILGVNCSPRVKGNTEGLMREALASAEQAAHAAGLPIETELVLAAKMNIKHCTGCLSCHKTGKCTGVKDDDMHGLYPKMEEADGILFGAPVYGWGINDLAVSVLNRTTLFIKGKRLREKVAGAVITTGRAGEVSSFDSFLRYFSYHRMQNAGGVFAFGGMEKGGCLKDVRAMDEARGLGRVMVRLIYHNQTCQRIPSLEGPMAMSIRGNPTGGL